MRTFETGATRNSDDNKPDFEGFFSPLVIGHYGQYMHEHRRQADGKLRDADNWQKGFGLKVLMSSLWRHFYQAWTLHRGFTVRDWDTKNPVELKEALCGLIFNAQAYLHEVLVKEHSVAKECLGGCAYHHHSPHAHVETRMFPPNPMHNELCTVCGMFYCRCSEDVARMEAEGGPAN